MEQSPETMRRNCSAGDEDGAVSSGDLTLGHAPQVEEVNGQDCGIGYSVNTALPSQRLIGIWSLIVTF